MGSGNKLVTCVLVIFAILSFSAAAYGLGYLMFDIIKTLLLF